MEKFFAGDPLAASRLMSIVEQGGEEAEAVLDAIYAKVGDAYRIGITGLTGAGKSSLINKLTSSYRRTGKRVGVVAVDPTSPFSGGALLGDRIRMSESSGDEGVFIRSVASRGSETGLSACADELADVLDAFGSEIIFLETIGVGQLEYKVRFSASTIVVVLVPEAGDDVQSLKSGLMEIGDIFVVNKSDRARAEHYAGDLRNMLKLRRYGKEWCPPVVPTIATKGEGVDLLIEKIAEHEKFLESNGDLETKRDLYLAKRISAITEEKLRELFWGSNYVKSKMEAVMKDVTEARMSPYEAARELVSLLAIRKGKGE